jgi:hypothetical protein
MTITDILDECNIDYRTEGQHEHVRVGWIGVDCPSCSPDWKHYRLGINVKWRKASCWQCGGKRLDNVLRELTGKPWDTVKKWLAELGAGEPSIAEPERRGKLVLPFGLGPLLPIHRRYLQNRGFDPDLMAKLWGVQGISMAPRLAWRLFVPFIHNTTTVSWTTRAIEGPARYIAAEPHEEIVNHKQMLGGEHLARHAIIVVEGPTDAMAIGPGAVWTSGTQFTSQQVQRISRYPIRCVLYDAESAAQDQARRMCDMLGVYQGRTVRVELSTGKDPAEAGKQEIAQIRRLFLD